MINQKVCTLLAYIAAVSAQNCETEFEEGVNYFEDYEDITTDLFTVEYFDTYKKVENLQTPETLYLYICGSPIPAEVEEGDIVVSVPIEDYGISSQSYLARLHAVQAIPKLSFDFTGVEYQECYGEVAQNYFSTFECTADDCPETVNEAWASMENPAQVVFCNFGCPDNPPAATEDKNFSVVSLPDNGDGYSLEDKVQWTVFLSLFFNDEIETSELIEDVLDESSCLANPLSIEEDLVDDVESRSDSVSSLNVLVTTLYFSSDWSLAGCPNYYCDYVETVADRTGIEFTLITTESFEVSVFNSTELVTALDEAGIEVDIFIHLGFFESPFEGFPGPGDDGSLEQLMDGLGLDADQVFFIPNTDPWFSLEPVIPQVAQSDFVTMLSPESTNQPLYFFQRLDGDNEFIATITGTAEECGEFLLDVCTLRDTRGAAGTSFLNIVAFGVAAFINLYI
eukprot:snap_masked-scaffold_29-processed-gene-2.53-mRNA-1 protein AED:1.00 eAED:1.00 QI:0/-1/0/0/-1/1/1/0/452